jgi:DNA-binding NtrC family response regulator
LLAAEALERGVKPRVLLVEGDVERAQRMVLEFSERFDCHHVATVEDAMARLPEGPWAAVVADYVAAGGGTGLEMLQVVRESAPRSFRIFCTVHITPGVLHDVRRLLDPHFIADARQPDFITSVRLALEALLAPPSQDVPSPLPSIMDEVWVGRAPATVEFLRELRVAAELEVPVYVYGEPGSGRTRAATTLRRWRREWEARGSPGAGSEPLFVPTLRVPFLRERPQDMPILVARILLEHARQGGEPPRRISARTLEALLEREWRGNIIELAGVLFRALRRIGVRTVIEPEDLPADSLPAMRPSQYAKDEGQRDCVLRQLRTARSVSAAARLEGCSRSNYIRLMRRLGIIRADVVVRPEAEEPVEGLGVE